MVACRADARRYFFDLARLNKAPIGIEAVARINALFAIEHEINGSPRTERRRVRQEQASGRRVWVLAAAAARHSLAQRRDHGLQPQCLEDSLLLRR